MAQISYFMTDAETHELVQTILQKFHAEFTPEVHSTSSFPRRSTLDDLLAAEPDGHFRTRYFITSPLWGVQPFHVKELHQTPHHYFYLFARCGGPYFDHVPSRYDSEASAAWVGPGTLADYPSYLSQPGSPASIPRPPAMAAAFRDIRRSIVKSAHPSRNVEKGFRGPYITPGAAAFFRAGGWLRIGEDHFEPIS